MRYRFDIAYDGTNFSGWARQPDRRTVCGELERHLSMVLRQTVELTVAGRTDAGVHASGQVAHADLSVGEPNNSLTLGIPGVERSDCKHNENPTSRPVHIIDDHDRFIRRMSRILPDDIRILRVRRVPPAFDARFSALRRHYEYRLTTAPFGLHPLHRTTTAAWRRPLDVNLMQEASDALIGLHDFAAFCRKREGATTIRELQQFSWHQTGDLFVAQVSADAFCWSMVRSLVGAVAAVGDGRRTVQWCADLVKENERSSCINVADARGLSLLRVDYPPDEQLQERAETTRDRRVASDHVPSRESGPVTIGDARFNPDDCC